MEEVRDVSSLKHYADHANPLSSGDYDGDKALLLWDPALVVPFRNADLKYADEPQEAKDAFEQSIKVVSEFLEETKDVSREDKIRLIQSYTLSEIVTASKIGIYNQFYLQSLYMTGYNDPETILLAYMYVLQNSLCGRRDTDLHAGH